MTYKVDFHSTSGEASTFLWACPGSTNAGIQRDPRIPFTIPRDQVYFWTRDWQESEGRAEADLAAGRSAEFDSFAALARDLLS